MQSCSDPSLLIRKVTMADLEASHALTQRLGWTHRLDDWRLLLDLGQGVAVVDRSGIIATGFWWPYGPSYAMLGMIIVDPCKQGQGIGRQLMQEIFAETGGRTLMLNATEAGLPLYQKVGFQVCGHIWQHQGNCIARSAPLLAANERFVDGRTIEPELLYKLDHAATGLTRDAMLRRLQVEAKCIVLERENIAVGFSMIREFGLGLVIGPVVATDTEAARALIGHWLFAHRGRFIRLDLVDDTGLGPWLNPNGLVSTGGATAMVRGTLPAPAGPARKIGLVGHALG